MFILRAQTAMLTLRVNRHRRIGKPDNAHGKHHSRLFQLPCWNLFVYDGNTSDEAPVFCSARIADVFDSATNFLGAEVK